MQFGGGFDVHEVASFRRVSLGLPFPGQIRIPSLAPSFSEEFVKSPDFCDGFAINFRGRRCLPGSSVVPRVLLWSGFHLPARPGRRTDNFSSVPFPPRSCNSCCSVLIAASACLLTPGLPAANCDGRPVATGSDRPIKYQ